MPQKTRTIVTENHTLTRKGYVSLLREMPDISVIGEAENGKELIKLLGKLKADLILLDIEMPQMSGKEALKLIKTKYPETRVIMLTFHNEETTMLEYIKLGASAFVTKDSSYEEFEQAINGVIEEGYFYHKNISKALLKELARKETVDIELTEREREIIVLTCQGKSNKEIAGRLNIVVKTVDFHKANIYKKTKTHSVTSLYNFALKRNLITEKEE